MSLAGMALWLICFSLVGVSLGEPFFQQLGSARWAIGNSIWNITLTNLYGNKLYFQNRELVGAAKGHYAGYGELPFSSLRQEMLTSWRRRKQFHLEFGKNPQEGKRIPGCCIHERRSRTTLGSNRPAQRRILVHREPEHAHSRRSSNSLSPGQYHLYSWKDPRQRRCSAAALRVCGVGEGPRRNLAKEGRILSHQIRLVRFHSRH